MEKIESCRKLMGRLFDRISTPHLTSGFRRSRQPSLEVIHRKLNKLLHQAVRKNNTAMVRVLLRLGGDVGAMDAGGYSLFERACIAGNPETVTSLLHHVDTDDVRVYPALLVAAALAPPNIQEILAPILRAHRDATDHAGRTAVTLACSRDLENVVRRLTSKARYLCCSDDPWRDPFLTSCRVGSASLVTYLANKVKCVVNRKDSRERTPLHFLCARGTIGPNGEGRKWRGNILELYTGIDSVIEILLRRGADVNARDSHQRTPLHVLCDTASRQVGPVVGQLAVIAVILLKHGADVIAVDYMGHTPFQLCKNYSFFNYLRLGEPRMDPALSERLVPLTSVDRDAGVNLIMNATLPFLTWPDAPDPLLALVLTIPKVIKNPVDALDIVSATYPRLVYNCVQHVRGNRKHDRKYPCELSARALQCLLHMWLVYHPVHVDSRFFPFSIADFNVTFPGLKRLTLAAIRRALPQKQIRVLEQGLMGYLPARLVNEITLRHENEALLSSLYTKIFD